MTSNDNSNSLFEKMKTRVNKIPSNWDKPVPKIEFKFSKNQRHIISTHERELIESKNSINKYKNRWNFYRDLLNPYEFNNISKVDYINRAYFKLHEIIKIFGIEEEFSEKKINYTGVCEFPCGFTKCLLDNKIISKNIVRVNIMSNNDNKPKIKKEDRIEIDIFDLTNKAEMTKVLANKAHKSLLVTADGGINEKEEYAKKEELHFKLKLYEVGVCLRLLDEGGMLIIKFFEFFATPSKEMVYYLSFFFKELYVYKPLTSRPTNSERYLICKNRIRKESNLALIIPDDLTNLTSFLEDNIPICFSSVIRKINNNIANIQINNINFVIEKIDKCIDDKEKKYFLDKKDVEQKKFFEILKIN